VSIFLRWGIFGILGVAALLYAYNASKRMAERHPQTPNATVQTDANAVAATDAVAARATVVTPPAPIERGPAAPAYCETELVIAQRAIEARKSAEPLDRLLRIREIAFEDWPPRRARFELVATRFYNYEGDFIPEALRIAVISDCVQHSPAAAATAAP
jgi:hypothetical protein